MNDAYIALSIIFTFCASCSQIGTVSAEEITAERLYEDAFKLIVEGDYGEAYDRLEEIIGKYPGTVYARFAEDRKRRLEELNLSSIGRREIDQSGRIESVVFSTLYSTWLGVGSARLANAESEKATAAGMMIGAPAGLLTSLTLTRNARLSKGQAALINFSGYWGTWQGLGLGILLDKDDDEKTLIGSAMAGGLLGILTTSALTRRIDLSLGDASIINYGGLWGTWLSFCIAMIANIEDGNSILGSVLIGGNLGAASMTALSTKVEFSPGQASLISLSGVVGTLAAAGVLAIVAPAVEIESVEVVFATLMAGGILGLWGGYDEFGMYGQDATRRSGQGTLSWSIGDQSHRITSKEVTVRFLSVHF